MKLLRAYKEKNLKFTMIKFRKELNTKIHKKL